ncbi:hypothetical protein MPER_08149 [Moniliophthora perniciosa FA553]|nr:hypothetical protein MPER_08149 [Moniliophthora perniciosa FA553]
MTDANHTDAQMNVFLAFDTEREKIVDIDAYLSAVLRTSDNPIASEYLESIIQSVGFKTRLDNYKQNTRGLLPMNIGAKTGAVELWCQNGKGKGKAKGQGKAKEPEESEVSELTRRAPNPAFAWSTLLSPHVHRVQDGRIRFISETTG